MSNFLEDVLDQLQKAADRVVMREVRGDEFVSVSGSELLDQVARMRAYLRQNGLQSRDRCALLGPNSVQWTALDLALMMKDCRPRFFFVSEAALGDGVSRVWDGAPRRVLFDEVL